MGLTQTHVYYCFSNVVIHKVESKYLTKLQPLCERVYVGIALLPVRLLSYSIVGGRKLYNTPSKVWSLRKVFICKQANWKPLF